MASRTVIPIQEEFTPYEPTLEEMLSDPLVMTVMRADGVDPAKLRAMLHGLTHKLRARQCLGVLRRGSSPPAHFACSPHG